MGLLSTYQVKSAEKRVTLSTRKKKKPGRSQRQKYTHPVPAAPDLLAALEKLGRPVSLEKLGESLKLESPRHLNALTKKLAGMVAQGQVLKNRNNEYCLVQKLHLNAGRVSAHKDGFGFVMFDDRDDDVYLSAREMRPLFDGDRVAIRISGRDSRGRAEGKVVEILQRNTTEVAGQFIRERGIALVLPDNPKITHRVLIPSAKTGGAKAGQMVVVKILDYPTRNKQATGQVIEVLGEPGERGMPTSLAIHAHGIPNDWPAEVLAQAETFGANVVGASKKNREDLRHLALVTIDGEDARDFDDAVYCEPTDAGWRLIVAIADVANYVQQGSPLDVEAVKRGTSVYFPDQVVPMLPEALSNGLCSLNPNVDRLALVCDMQVGRGGGVSQSRFYNAVIRSAKRLTYTQAAVYLETGKPASGVRLSAEVKNSLSALKALYRAFAKSRKRRGALELDIPQLKILMNDFGEIESIRASDRNDAHKLIEECMIAANVEAAKFLGKHRIPGLYRVHARPKQARFDEFREYLLTLGFKVPLADSVKPKDFVRLLDAVKGRPDSHAISMALLRSMAHAEYTPANDGHFGLALRQYAHFTSPIRRYPDLLVHRAIKHIVGGSKAGNYGYTLEQMEQLGTSSSATERRAEEATREVEAWLKCQYMHDKIGQRFRGQVSSVTAFGLFVMIPELQVDGLVHVSSLRNDYYEFDADRQALIGARSNKQYALGDKLDIVVHKVDMDTRRIDFRLAGSKR